MIKVNLFFDYITSLLAKQPLEFDHQKYMLINLLNDLKSVEKYHKIILTIQKWIFEKDVAEKHLGTDVNKSDNILIYCNETLNLRPVVISKQKLENKTIVIESKKKLLNVLNETDLNQRLLQKKTKSKIEQAQLKLNEFHNILNLSLDVYNRLHSQNTVNNTKIDEILALMNSTEFQLENRITYFKLSVNDLEKSITDISKRVFSDFKYDNITQKSNKCVINTDLLNAYIELEKLIDSFNQTNQLNPLKTILQNENVFDIDWNDFLKTYKCTTELFISKIHQYFSIVTIINTFVNNLNDMEQELNKGLRKTVCYINNVHNEWSIHKQILNKLNNELVELKKNKSYLIISNHKSDNLKCKCIENIRCLENEIYNFNTQLTMTTKNNIQVNHYSQNLDLLFHTTSQNYINQLDIAYQLLFLHNDKKMNKATFLNKDLKIIRNKYNKLLMKRKEIMVDEFNKNKFNMKTIINEKSLHIVKTRDLIVCYKNKITIYKEFIDQLKSLNTYKTNANNDLLLIYHDSIFQNHGKTLEQLKDEEIEFTSCINLYNKELDELNKEDRHIDKNSKYMILNMNNQINNLDKKLQQVTSANKSLEKELNKK